MKSNVMEAELTSGARETPREPGAFDWPLAYEAETLLRERISRFLEKNTFGRRLSERMRDETGTDFFEWVDYLVLSPEDEPVLQKAGFLKDSSAETPHGEPVYEHPRATLPRVLIARGGKQNPSLVAIHPESIATFIAAHHLTGPR